MTLTVQVLTFPFGKEQWLKLDMAELKKLQEAIAVLNKLDFDAPVVTGAVPVTPVDDKKFLKILGLEPQALGDKMVSFIENEPTVLDKDEYNIKVEEMKEIIKDLSMS